MRTTCIIVAGCLMLSITISPVESLQAQKQAGEKGGWINLFPDKNLQGWKRVPLAPDTKLSERNPWKVDAKNKILMCDGRNIKEMLLYQKPLKDGIFHVEWRFRPIPGKKLGYNGGVYVRSANNGKVWIQAQVAMLDKRPMVADLFADLPVKGKIERVKIDGTGHKHVNPVGKWNTYDIHCQGKTITVKLNGKTVTMWKDCPRTSGYFGLQAELYYLEFKNIKWKAAK